MNLLGECDSFCPHGGQCRKDPDHKGKHRSSARRLDPSACEWTDAEAISREQADALLMQRPGGARIVAEQHLIEDQLRLLEDQQRIYEAVRKFFY